MKKEEEGQDNQTALSFQNSLMLADFDFWVKLVMVN